MIFHRRTGQAETVRRLDAAYQLAGGGIGILDGLRFVQHRDMPFPPEQDLVIAGHQRIGREHDVMFGDGGEVLFALGAVQHQQPQIRREFP